MVPFLLEGHSLLSSLRGTWGLVRGHVVFYLPAVLLCLVADLLVSPVLPVPAGSVQKVIRDGVLFWIPRTLGAVIRDLFITTLYFCRPYEKPL